MYHGRRLFPRAGALIPLSIPSFASQYDFYHGVFSRQSLPFLSEATVSIRL